jgi:hypothetical protein
MNGLDEHPPEFRRPVTLDGPARFRSFAGLGPVCESMAVGEKTVRIRMVDSDEELDYPLTDAELDPPA